MQIVTGQHHREADRSAFWNDVAFYNYVQVSVGDSARVRPTAEMFGAAERPFWRTLRELKPTHMLVLGAELWESLPSEGYPGAPVRPTNDMFTSAVRPWVKRIPIPPDTKGYLVCANRPVRCQECLRDVFTLP